MKPADCRSRLPLLLFALALANCASEPTVPYPAFVKVPELPDSFVASLPGIRAKQLAGNMETRQSSQLLTLPSGWEFTTGGLPDKSVEIYVIVGSIRLGGIDMPAGGYAYLPSGTSGVPITTDAGANILYFLDDAIPGNVIQTPLIVSRDLIAWESSDSLEGFGLSEKVLREDPGTGAKTWLLKVEPGAAFPWQRSAATEEGFLLEGNYQHAECVAGVPVTGEYVAGGYFQRPPEAVNGGPESGALQTSVWYLRRVVGGETEIVSGCTAATGTVEGGVSP